MAGWNLWSNTHEKEWVKWNWRTEKTGKTSIVLPGADGNLMEHEQEEQQLFTRWGKVWKEGNVNSLLLYKNPITADNYLNPKISVTVFRASFKWTHLNLILLNGPAAQLVLPAPHYKKLSQSDSSIWFFLILCLIVEAKKKLSPNCDAIGCKCTYFITCIRSTPLFIVPEMKIPKAIKNT